MVWADANANAINRKGPRQNFGFLMQTILHYITSRGKDRVKTYHLMTQITLI